MRIQTQKKVLSVLKDLKQRTGKDWWDILYVILMVYRPWQIDPRHERNKGLIGWKRNTTGYTRAERFATMRAILNLERMGLIEGRIVRTRDDPELNRKRIELGSFVSEWKEIRLSQRP